MSNNIDYKNFEESYFQHQLQRSVAKLPKMLSVATTRGDKLYYLYINSKRSIVLNIVNNETDSSLLKKYFSYTMQGMYGHLYSLLNIGKPVDLFVGDKKVALTNNSKAYSYLFYLFNIMSFAQICRCNKLIDLIINIPETSIFFQHPNQEQDKILYKIMYSNRRGEITDMNLFNEYRRLYLEKFKDKDSIEFNKFIYIPKHELEIILNTGNENEFNLKLKEALELNRKYYDTPEDNRYKEIDNMLPWSLISIACQAYDKGWNITVEDSRLPMFLVRGECSINSLECI
jgi:hypothetical protein